MSDSRSNLEENDSQSRPQESRYEPVSHSRYTRLVLLITLIVSLVLLLWYAVDVFLLIFAGVLLAIFLRALSDWLTQHSPLSGGWSLAVVVLVLISVIGLFGWLLAPRLAEQIDELSQTLPRSIQNLSQSVERYGWGRRILDRTPSFEDLMPDKSDVLAKATGVFSTTFGVIVNAVVILFVGLYLAVNPKLYKDGFVSLFPLRKRQRTCEVLDAVGSTLRWWLLGKVIAMILIGILTTAGLWLLDVPLALTFGVLSAIFTFVPNVGPPLAILPAILLALTASPTRALYVLLLYLLIQTVESYLLTPVLQQRVVSLPPALTISAQILMAVLLGGLGLALATPLTAIALVLVKMLYVEDVLEADAEVLR